MTTQPPDALTPLLQIQWKPIMPDLTDDQILRVRALIAHEVGHIRILTATYRTLEREIADEIIRDILTAAGLATTMPCTTSGVTPTEG